MITLWFLYLVCLFILFTLQAESEIIYLLKTHILINLCISLQAMKKIEFEIVFHVINTQKLKINYQKKNFQYYGITTGFTVGMVTKTCTMRKTVKII